MNKKQNFYAAIIVAIFLCLQLSHGSSGVSFEKTPAIKIVGNKFFDSENGEQFFIKGIAYQLQRSEEELSNANGAFERSYIDALADPKICLRDIPFLKMLGVNTLRVYAIDPTKSHDICMEALSAEGMYVLLDLSEPDISINRENPSWDVHIFERYKSVIDAMSSFPNLLGYFAGNEVTNDHTNTFASPFVKAAIRDAKEYISHSNHRKIPVGYSTNDDAMTRDNLARYFVCGDVKADFYGINMYEWCGYSTYGTSGYRERTKEFEGYPIPVFFSEFGCNLVRPRPFTEVSALYGKKMSSVWSGGLAYMYFEEENEYGVVKINDNDGVDILPDFKNLKKEFAKADPKGITEEEYLTAKEPTEVEGIECPHIAVGVWEANEKLPETPDRSKCACLDEVLPCEIVPFGAESGKYEEYFSYMCSKVDCSDIHANGKTGEYGEFSDCSVEQKLSLQLSKLYYKIGANDRHCPLNDKNVYFNLQSLQPLTSESICKNVFDSIRNITYNHGDYSKSNPSRSKESLNVKYPSSEERENHGTIAFKTSGFVILLISMIAAGILL
ncbi:AQG_2a_G0038560.mRNA.1.CDS.1 [Saccharomyces cerevisiae]|uniref:1,3-beta-glucanosyltransferase n=4 Tax=Saccharomyces TaxID=4930 RepID=C8ZDV0_YEAS8|nr:Gas2p [Saccharomyces cerevisiae YJM993]AJP40475.1 Gas2p [Saccharomyces cerevisiae YJM1078]AJV48645.1 Gas2p [Saccharomyces cerevisiae YJM1202]AJV49550.1 Gas2p [Saccharomyces cerevisiae YJM1242]AJV50004.1 Gas2p [Saccharomyces cerevisiae YJM1244]AJV51315.1 Gas2p [Saccharomyces cerevisiae YJM1252]AJV53112.1 Gas2p [Saccharomyces cerevisiae YJM1311]AJV53553.1 Gas2p [Saccharomyces cerevisiae YJM1326]AJV54005.1 Gas2p [Saccharomyces cerevisiae YJM1332]AJV54460.1 Gas2p [Saccharomyces cerevisiae Y